MEGGGADAGHLRRHGVPFAQARLVFNDVYADEPIDERYDYGEERINRIGFAGGALLVVTYTMRAQRRRIISARRADPDEADASFTRNEF